MATVAAFDLHGENSRLHKSVERVFLFSLSMKKIMLLSVLSALLPLLCHAQVKKYDKSPSIHVSTAINYYPALKPYRFFSPYDARYGDLILKYLTPSSGTFTIEDGDTIELERVHTNHFPSQVLGIGASIQVKKPSGAFHEVTLTRLSAQKSSNFVSYLGRDTLGNPATVSRYGYEEQSFVFAFRYEYGKYFGDEKAKFRFGLSGGLEPSLYWVKRTPLSSQEYPVNATILALDFSVIPTFSFALSKKLILDFKAIPNALVGDFGKVSQNNPTLPKAGQAGGKRTYKSPDVSLAFSVLLRYTIKESVRGKK